MSCLICVCFWSEKKKIKTNIYGSDDSKGSRMVACFPRNKFLTERKLPISCSRITCSFKVFEWKCCIFSINSILCLMFEEMKLLLMFVGENRWFKGELHSRSMCSGLFGPFRAVFIHVLDVLKWTCHGQHDVFELPARRSFWHYACIGGAWPLRCGWLWSLWLVT